MKNNDKLTLPFMAVYLMGASILALLTIPYFLWKVGQGVVKILFGSQAMRPKHKQILEALEPLGQATCKEIAEAAGIRADHAYVYICTMKVEGLVRVFATNGNGLKKGINVYSITNLGLDELEEARGEAKKRRPTPWGRVSSVFQMAEVL